MFLLQAGPAGPSAAAVPGAASEAFIQPEPCNQDINCYQSINILQPASKYHAWLIVFVHIYECIILQVWSAAPSPAAAAAIAAQISMGSGEAPHAYDIPKPCLRNHTIEGATWNQALAQACTSRAVGLHSQMHLTKNTNKLYLIIYF